MVNHDSAASARYVSNSDGAPPVPPPGGYRGARRQGLERPPASAGVADPFRAQPEAATPPPRDAAGNAAGVTPGAPGAPARPARTSPLGWIALSVACVFALALLIMLTVGATDTIYSATMLAVQLIVLAIAIAALATRKARMLGAISLALVLLFNVATIGGLGALRSAATGQYDGQKSQSQKLWEGFPGVKGRSSSNILNSPSLEEVRSRSERLLADLREELTRQHGFTWVETTPEDLRPERNGYGGESMLVQYMSPQWATLEPVTGYANKLDVMATIDEVLVRHGFWNMISFNDASGGLDPALIEKMYGDTDPRRQVNWEWYSDNYPDSLRFYAEITDLANDRTGEHHIEREAQSARTGEPLEGLRLTMLAPELLSNELRDAFDFKMRDFPAA